jgi:mono/diheme cytochrome c family protein
MAQRDVFFPAGRRALDANKCNVPLRPLLATAALLCSLTAAAADSPPSSPQRPPATDAVALGRYLVVTTGCNDCHTPRYAQSAGQVPETEWLVGDRLGWHGPWGTTYPTNLRLHFSRMTEAQWLLQARHGQSRPPMPWFNLRAMSDGDLRAIYRYVRAAGPAGEPVPAALPPGETPPQPHVRFP